MCETASKFGFARKLGFRIPFCIHSLKASITCVGFLYQNHFLWHGLVGFARLEAQWAQVKKSFVLHINTTALNELTIGTLHLTTAENTYYGIPASLGRSKQVGTRMISLITKQTYPTWCVRPLTICQNLRGRDITVHLISVISGLGIGGFAYEDYATLVQDLVRVMRMPDNRASVIEHLVRKGWGRFGHLSFGSQVLILIPLPKRFAQRTFASRKHLIQRW